MCYIRCYLRNKVIFNFTIMKNINVNELQNQISKIMRQVESGEVYQVSRYSKPVAYLVPQGGYEAAVSGQGCKACVEDLRKISQNSKFKSQNSNK